MAKDLGMKNKEILAKIEGSGITVKSYMATLEPDDFNVFFDELTRENQIKDLDGYLSGKTRICRKKAEEKKNTLTVNYAEEAARELGSSLGRGCRIVAGRKKGRIELEYYGVDDLNDLLDALALLQVKKKGTPS